MLIEQSLAQTSGGTLMRFTIRRPRSPRGRHALRAAAWSGPTVSVLQLDRLAVRGAPVGVRPRLLAAAQFLRVREALGDDEPFECREPTMVVVRAIIRLTPGGAHPQLFRKRRGPLLPAETALLRQGDGQSECRGLPRLAKDRTVFVAR